MYEVLTYVNTLVYTHTTQNKRLESKREFWEPSIYFRKIIVPEIPKKCLTKI